VSVLDFAVLGAGLSGLAAARVLARAGLEGRVIELGDAVGGVARSDRVDGFLVERGPNTFRIPGELARFLEEYGLESALLAASPASRRRFLLRQGVLTPVPMGLAAFATTPLLSARAKLRLLAEPFAPRAAERPESAAEFVTRRLGREVSDSLVGPFLTGVYAGDEEQLGAETVFASLVEMEREHGSIARGGLASLVGRKGPRGRSGTWSSAGGLGGFAEALSAGLDDLLMLETRVEALESDGAGYRIGIEGKGGSDELRARSVVVALPAPVAGRLLRDTEADAAAFASEVDFAPIVALALAAPTADFAHPPEGFGFLVPRDEPSDLLGCLFMSRLFPGRAPEGHELLHCMMGGTRWREALDLSDDVLVERAAASLSPLGLRAEPSQIALTRWTHAVAQPDKSHARRVAGLRRSLAARRGLRVAGAYLEGVSVAHALLSGVRAASELLELSADE